MSRPRFNEEKQLTLPWEYLTSTSDDGLRNFEQLQLTHAANLEKEMVAMRREAEKAKVMAEVTRLLIDHRSELMRHLGDHLERAGASEKVA